MESDDEIVEVTKTCSGKLRRSVASMIITAGQQELKDRKKTLKNADLFKDFEDNLKCTKCSAGFADSIKEGKDLMLHPILKVLYCNKCLKFYGDGNFSLDEDEDDKYCRWCGEGGTLFLCSNCICGFCPKCIKKNLGNDVLKAVKADDNWNCFICNPEPLWKLRHVTYLATQQAKLNKKQIKEARESRLFRLKKKVMQSSPGRRATKLEKTVSSSSSEHEKNLRRGRNASKLKKAVSLSSSSEDEKNFQRVRKATKLKKGESLSSSSEDEKIFQRGKKAKLKKTVSPSPSCSAESNHDELKRNGEEDEVSDIPRAGETTPIKVTMASKKKSNKATEKKLSPKPNSSSDDKDKEITEVVPSSVDIGVKSVIKVLKKLNVIGQIYSTTAKRLLKDASGIKDDASLKKLNTAVGKIIDLSLKIGEEVKAKQSIRPKETDKSPKSVSTGASNQTEISFITELVNLGDESEISVLHEKIINEVEIIDSSSIKEENNESKSPGQLIAVPKPTDDIKSEEIVSNEHNTTEMSVVTNEVVVDLNKAVNSNESEAADVKMKEGPFIDSSSNKEKDENISPGQVTAVPKITDDNVKSAEIESNENKTTEMDVVENDAVVDLNKNNDSNKLVTDKDENSHDAYDGETSDEQIDSSQNIDREKKGNKVTPDNDDSKEVEHSEQADKSHEDTSKKDAKLVNGNDIPPADDSDSCNSSQTQKSITNTPHSEAKKKLLASTSDDSDSESKKKMPSGSGSGSSKKLLHSGSTDCSTSPVKKLKTRRQRTEMRVRRKAKEAGETSDVKSEEKEIASLINLKSLDRLKKGRMFSSDEVEKSETKNSKSKKIGKTKEEETLMDMINEAWSDSSDDEKSELKDDWFKKVYLNDHKALKNLVLGSSSSEQSLSEKEDAKSVKKKKSSKLGERKPKPASSGISDCSEDDIKSKTKRKIDSDSDSSSIFVSKKKKVKANLKKSVSEEEEPKKKRRRIKKVSNSSSSSSCDIQVKKKSRAKSQSDSDVIIDGSQPGKSPGKGRKNIKSLMKKETLQLETRAAVREEVERKKRLAKRQEQYVKFFGEDSNKLVLDFDDDGEILLEVIPRLVAKLKPHQIAGIKFMWDNCFESLKAMENSNGSGCILAHCMGLGKTMQVVTLLHTVMTQEIGVNTALIVCPLNTVANWVNEIEMWMRVARCETVDVYDLNKYRKVNERIHTLKTWYERGGILIISYDMYRNLTKKTKGMPEVALIRPGPDVVVCDEGHLLKNEDSVLSKCISQIQTARRIVLTGTPLQNNLQEYHCMVQFIKPNILGTKKEFMNRFVNPIVNGQFEDSTKRDVEIMKKRSHVLHNLLDGCIQRRDYSVLTPFLPLKLEYVLVIAMAEPMAAIYRQYIETISARANGVKATSSLFKDYQSLQRIWTHPIAMQAEFAKASDRKEKFINDEEEDDDDEVSVMSDSSRSSNVDSSVTCLENENSNNAHRSTRSNPVIQEEEPEKPWWNDMIEEKLFEEETISGKLVVLFSIIEECALLGDKVLAFSQSLFTLDVIEHFLEKRNEAGERWDLGINYFRLDGTSSSDQRSAWCKAFNREENKAAKLFLISTRAGGLGINLVGANRVVIFDASWNPSHDLQGIFRIYRFGQQKPCYVYRLLAEATMEEKIYERQVTKLSLAGRVVDEHQIERHYTMGNLQELYRFEPIPKDQWKPPILPKDGVLAKLLKNHKDVIVSYHEHDSLLENKQEEELTEEERKAAWEEYETGNNAPSREKILSDMQNAAFNYQSQMRAALQRTTDGNFPQMGLLGANLANAYMAQHNNLSGHEMPWSSSMGYPNLTGQPSLGTIWGNSNTEVQRLANPFATKQQNQMTTMVNPFAAQKKFPQLQSLERMAASGLMAFGTEVKILPKEGEKLESYRERLADFVRSRTLL